jgi:hypothetical protein
MFFEFFQKILCRASMNLCWIFLVKFIQKILKEILLKYFIINYKGKVSNEHTGTFLIWLFQESPIGTVVAVPRKFALPEPRPRRWSTVATPSPLCLPAAGSALCDHWGKPNQGLARASRATELANWPESRLCRRAGWPCRLICRRRGRREGERGEVSEIGRMRKLSERAATGEGRDPDPPPLRRVPWRAARAGAAVGGGEEETLCVPAGGDPRCAAAGGPPERRPPPPASTALLPLAPSLLRRLSLHSAGGHPPSRRRPLPSLQRGRRTVSSAPVDG